MPRLAVPAAVPIAVPAAWKALTALVLLAALALLVYAAVPWPAGASSHWTDYDTDDNGLIDITTIARLQGIRFDHNGDGIIRGTLTNDLNAYNAAFPNRGTNLPEGNTTTSRMGCPLVCRGYELMNDLDFAAAAAGQRNWTVGHAYAGILEGNGYTIANLNVSRSGDTGLFTRLEPAGIVRNLGLIDPVASGHTNVGTLAGINHGTIAASYAIGGTSTIISSGNTTDIGGLVGENQGRIIASYAAVSVSGNSGGGGCSAGGLVGQINSVTTANPPRIGRITASYAYGPTSCATTSLFRVGGLIGTFAGAATTVTDTYCDLQASGTPRCTYFGGTDVSNNTADLQTPTAYTGLYANWNVDLTGDNFPDNPWNFGASNEYPTLNTLAQRQATVDYDTDGDNLIEINTLHQLNAIRHDLNGDGLPAASSSYPAYAGAFPGGNLATTTASQPRMGCPQTCTGYELMANLDFAADGMTVTTTDAYPNWNPIGNTSTPYAAQFHGNSHTISRLTTTGGNYRGLFQALASGGAIRDVGLIDPDIRASNYAAALVYTTNAGAEVTASYVRGGAITLVGGAGNIGAAGGLVAWNNGAIRAAYASTTVSGGNIALANAGVLVGTHSNGEITASYAVGPVAGTGASVNLGGLAGSVAAAADIADSHCDATVIGATPCLGAITGTAAAAALTTAQLQTPTAYTGIYANWNTSVDGDDFPDDPWDFRTASQYPVLRTAQQRQDAAAMDYDSDDDNLIDIRTVYQLNAVRHDLNGDGLPASAGVYAAYAGAFPRGDLASTTTRMGCAATCIGYELMANLDFAADGQAVTTTDAYPNWTGIGGSSGYSGQFHGNSHTISRLTITSGSYAGLFGALTGNAIVRDVALRDVNISGRTYVGGVTAVVQSAGAQIITSSVQGGSINALGSSTYTGGIAGRNFGTIRASYAALPVSGGSHSAAEVGGLVGEMEGGTIIASYATGAVTGTGSGALVGALVGQAHTNPVVTNSYCIASPCYGYFGGANTNTGLHTPAQLQTPTAYTGIYAHWNTSIDGDAFPDDPWDFRTASQYPVLRTAQQRQDAAAMDYDSDDDNLIDIRTVYQLNAVRHDLNGDGLPASAGAYAAYAGAFPRGDLASTTPAVARMGCPQTCAGYELMANLDFAADGQAVTTTDAYPNFAPIGGAYTAEFNGNGRTITRLTINTTGEAGLFHTLAAAGVIRDVGLIDPDIRAPRNAAGLVYTTNAGAEVTASYVRGGGITLTGTSGIASGGGLVAWHNGALRASYASTTVSAGAFPVGAVNAGVLVGGASGNGSITASYAVGPVSGTGASTSIGGLLGSAGGSSTVTDSHCDATVIGATTPCIGAVTGSAAAVAAALTTAQLQTPVSYTGIYSNWNLSIDADDFPDDPWNFGAATEYPTLKTPTERRNAPVNDYDPDDDNLIDIRNLDQLNAVRHDLNGDGLPAATGDYAAYAGAFPGGDLQSTTTRMGCAATCIGYELAASLDFAADGVAVTGTDAYPNWTPIGDRSNHYAAQFHGNGNTITRLTIDNTGTGYAGLFHTIGSNAAVRDVGILDASITSGGFFVGTLSAANRGEITASYALRGAVTATGTAGNHIGGLIGQNLGTIRAAYATAAVNAGTLPNIDVGGLVGVNAEGAIAASYAAGPVSGSSSEIGGLAGRVLGASSTIADSYCDTQTTGQTDCIGAQTNNAAVTADGKTTNQLQTPTGYTGIYVNWRVDADGDAFPDDAWNFGTATSYPMLKTPAQRAAAPAIDYDQDDDNLIDIDSVRQLNAIRYDLNGDGLPAAVGDYAAYAGAFPGGDLASTTPAVARMGCPQTCIGYELTADLDFAADGIAVTGADAYPDWTPIGGAAGYAATFDGQGRTITRLTIAAADGNAGLFHTIANSAVIRDVGIRDAAISGAGSSTGILAGVNNGEITASYVQDSAVTATGTGAAAIGGLTGRNAGVIRAAYATAAVTAGARANTDAGGLTGVNDGGTITASYAAGPVTGSGANANTGGLIGRNAGANAAITDSHCDTQATTQTACIGGGSTDAAAATGHTTAQLQTPTGYTGPYANWNISLDADAFPDYPWNFGTSTQYPKLNTPTQRQTQAAPVIDYDQNDNNLIDIDSLDKLNAIRHDLSGNGVPDAAGNYPGYVSAFPNGNLSDTTTPYMGCAAACVGYELTADLDFAANANAYPNWQSIGDAASPYTARFEGNDRSISNLTITSGSHAGLFGGLGDGGVIRDLAILTPTITGETAVGAFAAVMTTNSQITASYVQGGRIAITGTSGNVGGIVGALSGTIRAGHASTTAITGAAGTNAGGIAGSITAEGAIIASYAAAPVTGGNAGGLAGATIAGATITDSYCDTTVSVAPSCVATGPVTAQGHPTTALQSPTSYTGIYANWNIDLDGDGNNDYPWYFGTSAEYPVLNTAAQRAEMRTSGDLPPPALPRAIIPEPPAPYNAAADHPEIYENAEYEMTATCHTHEVDPETDIPQGATITFNLGSYNGPILLSLSIWTGERYMAYETQSIAEPALQRAGQTATLRLETNPAQTRFRLDGSRNGLRANLLLGYADCHTP